MPRTFGLGLHLYPSFIMYEGSVVTAQVCRLIRAIAACICDKYPNLMNTFMLANSQQKWSTISSTYEFYIYSRMIIFCGEKRCKFQPFQYYFHTGILLLLNYKMCYFAIGDLFVFSWHYRCSISAGHMRAAFRVTLCIESYIR